MPRRKNIRTTVDSDAKSAHLNSLDLDQHRTRESNLQRKAREDAIFYNSADSRPVSKFRFPSLGDGMNLNRGLNLISGPEMAELHQRLRDERNYYWGREKTKTGWRKKKRFKKPLQQLTVTVRPDFALALEFCERDGRRNLLDDFLLKRLLPGLVQEFEVRTDLEIISLHVHPEEGNLHLHMVFSTISRTHELLWGRDSVGRHGLRLLNISHTGTLRLIRGGFLDEKIGGFARHDLADRMKLSGEEPIDWILSKAVDDYCTVLFCEGALAPTYQKAREEYHAGLLKRMAENPKALAEEIRRMGVTLQEFAKEMKQELIHRSGLKQRVAQLEKEKQQLQQRIAATPKSEKKVATSDIDLELPIRKRLKGYLRDEFLTNCEAFDEVVWGLVAQGTLRARKQLAELAEDIEIPLTPEERDFSRSNLRTWDAMDREDGERFRE